MKKLLLALLILLPATVAGLSYYAYYTYIPEKIENKIINSFNNFGFTNLTFENITRENGRIIFSDISLDDKQFSTIGKLSVYFSLFESIFNPNFAQKIVINNMSLSGEISKGIVTFSGLDNQNQIIQSLINIPAKIIIIEDSTADILSEKLGGIKIDYNGQLKLSPDINNNNNMKIKGNALSTQKKISFQSKINGTISPEGELSIIAESDQISLTQENLNIKRGVATIEFQKSPKSSHSFISVEGDFSSVNWNNLPLRDVHASLKTSNNDYVLFAEGKTFGNQNINWNTKINKTDNSITAETTIIPSKFSELLSFLEINKRLKQNINFPAFALNLEHPQISISTKIDKNNLINGAFKLINPNPSFELEGDFLSNKDSKNIKGNIFSNNTPITAINQDGTLDKSIGFNHISKGEFIIRNISETATLEWFLNTKISSGNIGHRAFNINDIEGEFLYNSNSSKKIKKHLKFSLPLKPAIKQSGVIGLNITNENKQLFESIYLKIYGGMIKAQSPLFKDGVLSRNNKLIVSDINLADLFRDAKFKNTAIFGYLGGALPLIIKDGKVNIKGGILQSQGKGIIRLPRSLISRLFPDKTREMQIIRKALKNYHYDFFEIRVDGDFNGKIMLTINADGYNPDFNSKESININLYIETKFSKLFKELDSRQN